MNPIDYFLNRTSMYKLVLNGLWVLVWISFAETFLGWLPYTPIDLILSVAVLLFTARATNALCVLFTRATPAPEAASITALMLFFILTPLQSANDAIFFIIAAALAILSKYVLSIGRKVVFNPAAFAAFALSVAGSGLVSWWVSAPVLLPFMFVLGFFVVRKLRQGHLFWIFAVTALIVGVGKSTLSGIGVLQSTSALITTFPLVFLGTLMLTDPQTMPASEGKRSIYAFIVGLILPLSFTFASTFALTLGTVTMSPEIALLVGNLYAFAFDTKRKVALSFYKMAKLSRDIYEFAFVPSSEFQFHPGQYAELTVPHASADNRGVRRYMTFSSAPDDHFVRFTLQMPVECSTFKDAFRELKKDTQLNASAPYGGFVLPRNPDQKVLAVASGIGIAPFMSMFRHLAMRRERRDMVLIYTADTPLDFSYQDEIDSIKDAIGLRVIYLPIDFSELSDWNGPAGYITQALVEKEIRDYKKRFWYIAGPDVAVRNHMQLVQMLGVSDDSFKTQAFPGF